MSEIRKGEYSIYQEELEDLAYQPKGFIEKLLFGLTKSLFKNEELHYSFSVPVSEFLRGELFCSDISEATGISFTQRDLMCLLLDDFLYQAKQRNNPYDIYYELNIRSEHSLKIKSYDGESKTFKTKSSGKTRIFECVIRRKEALRLEVILSDIAEIHEERIFKVNDVLRILYSDFIQKYKKGELVNALENIIIRLKKNT
ncbi:hypothetical protein KM915_21080 [Cytobacillus oceanisediminis]|uniref:hypothetical protein n=1 Tax=Cytobacillus oceanisediminis TaxID=665099 RepID=UPI001C22229F|nr:hypothetical protein [Cytobacillus oceanisediminis]MBU8732546.1 hypothetical protein [Cytobacillus oceanisediminis]